MAMQRLDYATAIALNLLFPGAGYVYAERKLLGAIVFLMAFGPVVASLVMFDGMPGAAVSWLGLLSIIGAIDGYITVKRHNDILDAMHRDIAATEAQMTLRKCPWCAETIQREARICRFCNREVQG